MTTGRFGYSGLAGRLFDGFLNDGFMEMMSVPLALWRSISVLGALLTDIHFDARPGSLTNMTKGWYNRTGFLDRMGWNG